MALLFLDSFDHYLDTQMNTKWTTASYQSRQPGLHGYGMSGVFRKGLAFSSTTILMEAYINRINIPMTIFSLYDNGANGSGSVVEQIWCDYQTDGSIRVSRYGSNAVLNLIAVTAPDVIRVGIWYHFGWKVHLDPVNGSVEVRVNGAPLINLTGIKTTNDVGNTFPVSTYWSGVLGSFVLGDNANAVIFDDLVVQDDVADGINDPRLPGGGGFTKFLGPVEIRVKRPNGAGSVTGWTPTPTVPNYQNVDDLTSDDDTTYNSATPAQNGASDLFTMEDLAVGEDVLAVQSLVLARKTQEGTAAIAKLTNDGVTTRAGATVYQPSTYSYMHAPEPTAPDGSLWTAAKWNAIQYGYRRIL